MRFSFDEGLHGVRVVRAHCNLRDVNIAVTHRSHTKVLLARWLSTGGELCHGAKRRCFRRLSARVRINFSIEDEYVDVESAGEHVIQATITDVVSPAISADYPHVLFDERLPNMQT